jgi:hypothetical protein
MRMSTIADVGLVQGDHPQQLVGVGRLTDDLHAGIRE